MTKRAAKQNRESAVLRVPVEIMSLIFMFATSGYITPSYAPPYQNLCARMEIIISLVCIRWRAISLSMPSLWTTIHVPPSSAMPSNSKITVDRLAAYLERSKDKLLDMWLDLRRNTLPHKCEIDMIRTVIVHVSRWRQFILFPSVWFSVDDLISRVKGQQAPNLELFCLLNAPPLTIPGQLFIGRSPKLVNLWIDTAAWTCRPDITSISNLYIKEDKFSPLHPFPNGELSSLSHLTTLTLDGEGYNSCMVAMLEGMTTPSLKTLLIRNQYLRNCLTRWKAPLLETLILIKVSFQERQYPVGQQGYSFPNLRILVLGDNQPCDEHCGAVLTQLTSNIEELIISDSRRRLPSGYVFMLDLLDSRYVGHDSWPQLREVTLNIRQLDKENPRHYFRGLKTRDQISRPTIRLDAHLIETLNREWKDYLEELEPFCTIEPLDSSATTVSIHWPSTTLSTKGPFYNLLSQIITPSFRKYSFGPTSKKLDA